MLSKQEITEQEYDSLSDDEKRFYQRKLTKQGNYTLQKVAPSAGIKNMAEFHNAGYKGLYNGETADDIFKRKKIRYREDILDNMNEDELVDNLFRINQTKQKLLKDNVQGEKEAKDVHYEVGKKVRKAVRTFLIQDDKVIAIKYKTNRNFEYYDIPGGKIEDGETSEQASIREFKEETGIEIVEQEYKGNAIIECPNMIFDFDVYFVNQFNGTPLEFEENYSFWIDIDELLKQDKKIPSIEILKFLNIEDIKVKIYVNENHKILEIDNERK